MPRSALDDVAAALAVATKLGERGDGEGALRYLVWAKDQAPRSDAIREALGVVLYRLGRFEEALKELSAYRRLSAREDQNHLLADCARAVGADDRVEELVLSAEAAEVPTDRLAEAHIVLAATRASSGDLDGAWRALERSGLSPETAQSRHTRLWSMAAQLCMESGDVEGARDYLEAVLAVDPTDADAARALGELE